MSDQFNYIACNALGNDNVYIFSDGNTVASADMPFGLDPVYLNDYWISWNNGKNLHLIDPILETSIVLPHRSDSIRGTDYIATKV